LHGHELTAEIRVRHIWATLSHNRFSYTMSIICEVSAQHWWQIIGLLLESACLMVVDILLLKSASILLDQLNERVVYGLRHFLLETIQGDKVLD